MDDVRAQSYRCAQLLMSGQTADAIGIIQEQAKDELDRLGMILATILYHSHLNGGIEKSVGKKHLDWIDGLVKTDITEDPEARLFLFYNIQPLVDQLFEKINRPRGQEEEKL